MGLFKKRAKPDPGPPPPGSPPPLPPDGPLSVQDVAAALLQSVRGAGFHLGVDGRRGNARLLGPPGSYDPYLLTDFWIDEGSMTIETRLPVVLDPDRIDACLELATLLTGAGRVSFVIDAAGTPIARHTVRFTEGCRPIAQLLISHALKTTRLRAGAAEALFRAVTAGEDPGEVVAAGTTVPVWNVVRHPWTDTEILGFQWAGLTDGMASLDPGDSLPNDYSAEEAIATAAGLMRILEDPVDPRGDGGVFECCPGPIAFHADGVVECYGCAEPARSRHLKGTTIACRPGLQLGAGHVCARCGGVE